MQPQQLPGPDPALKRLEGFIGTWSLKGRTLDSKVDDVFARTTFEWLLGGFFLKQTFEADFMGMKTRAWNSSAMTLRAIPSLHSSIPIWQESRFHADTMLRAKT